MVKDSTPSFGLLDDRNESRIKNIDTSDPNEVKKMNESVPNYSDWEMRIYGIEDRIQLMDVAKATQMVSEVISTLLTCLRNARGYETEYEDFKKRYANLPKLGNLKITKQGDDYDIVDIQSNETIHVPTTLLKIGIQIAYDKQANKLLREAMLLKTDLKAFIRKELGYFDERKAFNNNEYVKMQMMNSAMPVTPEFPTSTMFEEEIPFEDHSVVNKGKNDNWLGRR